MRACVCGACREAGCPSLCDAMLAPSLCKLGGPARACLHVAMLPLLPHGTLHVGTAGTIHARK